MTFGPANTESPYLPISREYDEREGSLSSQLGSTYSAIALRLNNREISLYDQTETLTGQKWTNAANLQVPKQTFRKVFPFTAAGSTPHNLTNLTQVIGWGEFTDGTNFYGAIHGSNVAIAGQVSFYVTPTNLVILSGAGAPAITSGVIVLEYLKN
jgi:hypothetical protein